MASAYYLDPIPHGLRARAVEALEGRDVIGFLCRANNVHALELVAANMCALARLNLYEEALLAAWHATRTNNRQWPLSRLRLMFWRADRDRLRALAPLPGKGPFTVYRGVAGAGAARRVRGLSWTGSRALAEWFARRFPNLPDPAVFTVRVCESDVLVYDNERQEDEYIVLLPDHARPKRVRTAQSDKEAR